MSANEGKPQESARCIADRADIIMAKWHATEGITTIVYLLKQQGQADAYDKFMLESRDQPTAEVTGPFAALAAPAAQMLTHSNEELRQLPLYIEVRGVKWQRKNGDVRVSLIVNHRTNYGPASINTPYVSIYGPDTDPDTGESDGGKPLPDGMTDALENLLKGLRNYIAGARAPIPIAPSPMGSLFDQPATMGGDGLSQSLPVGDRTYSGDGGDGDGDHELDAQGKRAIVLYDNPKKKLEAAANYWIVDGRFRLGLHFIAPKLSKVVPDCDETFDGAPAALAFARDRALAWLEDVSKPDAKKFAATLDAERAVEQADAPAAAAPVEELEPAAVEA